MLLSKPEHNIHVFILFAVSLTVLLFNETFLSNLDRSDAIHRSVIVSNYFFCMLAMMVLSLFYFLHIIITQKGFHIRVLDISLILLFLYIFINRYLFHSTYGHSIHSHELLGLIGIYFVVRVVKKEHHLWIFLAVGMSASIQAIKGILQLFGLISSNSHDFKMTGDFTNPGPFAGFCVIVMMVTVSLYIYRHELPQIYLFDRKKTDEYLNRFVRENLLPGMVLVVFLIIPVSESRAAWLAAIVTGIYLLQNRYKDFLRKFFKNKLLVALVVLVAGGAIFGMYHFKKGSADGRLLIWDISYSIFEDHPFIGVGFDRFKSVYMDYQAAYFVKEPNQELGQMADFVQFAFNEFIQFGVEEGIAGLLILGLFLITVFFVPNQKKEVIVVKSGLIALGVFSFFSYPSEVLPIRLVLFVLLGLLCSESKVVFEFPSTWHVKFLRVAVSFLMVAGSFFLFSIAIDAKKAYATWDRADGLLQEQDYESSVAEYEKASLFFQSDGNFLSTYGRVLSQTGQHELALKTLLKSKRHLSDPSIEIAMGNSFAALEAFELAEEAYLNASNMIPSRFIPLYLLAKLYDESGQGEKALSMALTLLNKPIKVPSKIIQDMRRDMNALVDMKREEGFLIDDLKTN